SWSVIIYLSLYFQVMLCLLTTKNLFELDSLLKSYLWMTLILSSFYMAIPIRGWVEPLPNNNYFDHVMNWIRSVDMPSNSLPSGHVAYSLMGPFFFFAYGEEGDRKKWIFLLWGICISLSTVTTKQHLIGDVFCGTILALAFGFIWGLYARERVFLRMKGYKLKIREKWRRKRARKKLMRR
ncbi:MAG: phosphatase PAP2 family protein, partial [Planctomycetota bacterium]